jgi:hypothetical protein
MSRGHIVRRGRHSWRIKYDLPNAARGRRQTRYTTVRGKRQDAERELARLISAAHDGTMVEPSKTMVADYLRSWLSGLHGLAGKTRQEYGKLIRRWSSHIWATMDCSGCDQLISPIGTPSSWHPAGRMAVRSRPAPSGTPITFCTLL